MTNSGKSSTLVLDMKHEYTTIKYEIKPPEESKVFVGFDWY